MDAAEAAQGPVDILIANAGSAHVGELATHCRASRVGEHQRCRPIVVTQLCGPPPRIAMHFRHSIHATVR